MSLNNPEAVDDLANGVQKLGLDQQAGHKKKRPARAYHNLQAQPGYENPSLNGFQPPNALSQQDSTLTSPVVNGFSPYQPAGASFGDNLQSPFITPQIPSQQQYPQQMQQSPQLVYPGNQPQGVNVVPNTNLGNRLSVPDKRRAAEDEWQYLTFKSFENNVPPTATTKYIAFDQGCSIPKFSSLSLCQVPTSEALRASTKLPLGITVRPFAPVDVHEESIPEVLMDPFEGPLRCRRCRTYINPLMEFTHDQRFICNMCKFSNPVPHSYASPLGVDGKRLDYLQRPELCKGTVDFIVPESYWPEDKKPEQLHQLFLIDVSATDDIVNATVDAIREAIESLNSGVRVGIITYDERIHVFDLGSEVLNVHTVSDLDDPFIPIDKGLFVDPIENSYQINNALQKIPDLFRNFKSPSVAYGAALKVSLLALESHGGGKVTATLCKIPSWGPGILANTENKSKGSLDFKADSDYYQKLGDEFITKNVGLDLFVLSNSSVNLINSAHIVFSTGGLLKLYSGFDIDKDEIQFIQDFTQSVVNTRGYQAQLKIRCSNGLQVESYYGNFQNTNSSDPKLPILSSDQEFSALFKYDSTLNPKEDAHFQTALLYTGIDGVRRVRVMNSLAAIATDAPSVFYFANQDIILNIIIKNCLKFLPKQNPTEIKNTTTTKLSEIFTQYRALVANSNSKQGQLILPESLNTLAAYISSFQKSKLFKNSTPNNYKIYDYHQLNSLPLENLLLKLYPRIIALHELQENDATVDPTTGVFNMPENIRASAQYVKDGGAYLIYNGERLTLWIHSRVNPLLLEDLFGVDRLELLNPKMIEFPVLNTVISQQARAIVEHFQDITNRRLMTFNLLRQGLDGTEFQFGDFMVEDRAIDKTESYAELLQHIHRLIKENLDNEKRVRNSDADHDDHTLSQRFVQY